MATATSHYLNPPRRSYDRVLAKRVANVAVFVGCLLVIYATLGAAFIAGQNNQDRIEAIQ